MQLLESLYACRNLATPRSPQGLVIMLDMLLSQVCDGETTYSYPGGKFPSCIQVLL